MEDPNKIWSYSTNYNENIIARYASSNCRATYELKKVFQRYFISGTCCLFNIEKSDGSIQQKSIGCPT